MPGRKRFDMAQAAGDSAQYGGVPVVKILVVYYSSYGHVETLARAIAKGAEAVSGVEVSLKRVPPITPRDPSKARASRVDESVPLASPSELADYDAIFFGTPARFGNMAPAMSYFLDRTLPLWLKGSLIGKIGAAFTSTASQHGGHDTTISSVHTTLRHHGMVIVGVPYSVTELLRTDEITGGTPFGASTITGEDGSRQPSDNELEIARFQGKHVAEIAKKLARS